MTMIDIDLAKSRAPDGLGSGWGEIGCSPCIMHALSGHHTMREAADALGLPLWIVEWGAWRNDFCSDAERDAVMWEWAEVLAAAQDAEVDLRMDGPVWRTVRLNAILPIAMDAVGEGKEPWRVECRKVVQWSIDNDGKAAWAAGAAWAAWAAGAAQAAWAAGAAQAAWAAGAAGSERAEGARIHAAMMDALRPMPLMIEGRE